jgi:quercetin dioxygenase-like cupin family protein
VEASIKILRVTMMSVRIMKLSEVPGVDMEEEGFSGVNSVWAVLKRDDVTAFSSRIFRISSGGHTAMHAHDREHVAVVVRGMCRIEGDGTTDEAREGSVVAIPAGVPHRFSNETQDQIVLLIMNIYTGSEESEGPELDPSPP